MQVIASAIKVFRMSYNEVLNMGFAQLMFLFKENNAIYEKSNKTEDKNTGVETGNIDDFMKLTKGN